MRLTRVATFGVIVVAAIGLFATLIAFAAPGDAVADRVFGQGGSFTANTANSGGVSAGSLNFPGFMVVDGSGRLYVADWSNNRVLEYDSPLTSQSATHVFGQAGSFTTNVCNGGGVSASSLCAPTGVALDSSGHLYIGDSGNNRVLEYDNPLASQSATRVFGQAGSFATNTANNGGVSATSLSAPWGVAVDGVGHLYVVDASNYRVLEYDTPLTSANANHVFGQGGSFATNDANHGGISANSLNSPSGVAVDSSGHLYVSDEFNNRVLEYDNPLTSQTATRVFGQGGSFASVGCNTGGIASASLCLPIGMDFDAAGRLYVSDWGNSRVLAFDQPLTSQLATHVFGQAGSFVTGTANNGGLSSSSLNNPCCVARGQGGNLYVADWANHRILEYDAPLAPHASVGGVAEQPDLTALPAQTPKALGERRATYTLDGAFAVVLAIVAATAWAARRRQR